MRIFKTKVFSKWAKKESISNKSLIEAVAEMDSGLFDASFGAELYKKRVPIPGKGKRGGSRTIVAYRSSEKSFFVFGFLKSDRENISDEELLSLKKVAKDLMSLSESTLKNLLVSGKMEEITNG